MALNGIDVSSYQSALNVAAIQADFVIAKATQGTGYVNPVCDVHYQQAKQSNKLRGVYHFADHGDPIQEAEYFVSNIRGYVGDAILVLDWEGTFTSDVAWAKAWLDHVYALTGVRPLIYMSEGVVNEHDWSSVSSDYGLWVAKYYDMNPQYNYATNDRGPDPSVTWGSVGPALWQWTSTGRLNGYNANLDCDVFYGDANAWNAYAAVTQPAAPQEPAPEAPAAPQEPTPVDVPPAIQDPTPVSETTAPETPVVETNTVTKIPVVTPDAPVERQKPSVWQTIVQAVVSFINYLRGEQ